MNTPTYNTWSGYAFEQVCLAHVVPIKKALGISGILTSISTWRNRQKEEGAQIDLLIERADKVINICEIKYASEPFIIDKAYDLNLRNKIALFRSETKTNKSLQLTMITTFGLHRNAYSSIAQSEITMEELFVEG